jgi:hypothetical protein
MKRWSILKASPVHISWISKSMKLEYIEISILSVITLVLVSCGPSGGLPSDTQTAVPTNTLPRTEVISTSSPIPEVPTSTTIGNQPGSTLVPTIDPTLAPFLPNPDLTPGAADARVTQEDIHQTICVHGYTETVRPPESITEPMKKQSILVYGLADRKLGDYEYDHLIPLEIGGAPQDIKNLWPETHSGEWNSYVKDKLENKLNQLVCDGQLDLATAQQAVAENWIVAYLKYIGTP